MRRRGMYILAGVILLLAAAVCGVWIFKDTYAPRVVVSESMALSATATPITITPEPGETAEAAETPEPTAEAYECPVDFAALRSVNSDIYAWLEIDGTNISYPIVQDPSSNTFYLNHNSDGNYSANGAIFSEDYNTPDFSDPVTVLYGHHMKSGAMFGKLQQYFSDGAFFSQTDKIVVYTPDEKLEYGVFAAVPYASTHLLYNYDFTDDSEFESFFEGVFNVRSLEAQFREEYAPQPGDKVLVLSTCLSSNNTRRFLVMAVLLP